MSLLAQIKADQLSARKVKNQIATGLLTTLIGEIETALRKPDAKAEDDVVQETVKSFLKKSREFQDATKDDGTISVLVVEQAILSSYLPQQLTDDQLIDILSKQFPGKLDLKSKGTMMAYLKTHYANQYDGKAAANVVGELIKANA